MPTHTMYIGEPNVILFSHIVNLLRDFLRQRGFVEVHTQDRLSILAACEDPSTVATYTYANQIWPLPQTGQMWLEYELLTRPEVPGVFCVSTSYRQEPNPVPGRHKILFPMFEFESRGTINDLRALEEDVCVALGLAKSESFIHKSYDDMAEYYGVEELTSEHETRMKNDFGPVVFLERFPLKTSPFWNMRRDGSTHAHKIDVIIDGMETIGSAERSCSVEEMRHEFYSICSGGYAQKLFDLFGRERVETELEAFFQLPFVPRFGGGIGITRLVSALNKSEWPHAQYPLDSPHSP
ncbi:MAG: amino acid--tRNA ligase-related protein [Patescibacteria group bacterium]